MPSKKFNSILVAVILLAIFSLYIFGMVTMTDSAHQSTEFSNRLTEETSPYLLQHANNPVDWYPWGDEAFAKAKAENKPIFLSVGYSTCYWCHVMERESFMDTDVAKILNENFVSIKVDREERPDVDDIYMKAVQAITGTGGWPMSVFLTPDLKPFYAGTYFPKAQFIKLLNNVAKSWKDNKKELIIGADEVAKAINSMDDLPVSRNAEILSRKLNSDAAEQYQERFDSVYGGFGDAPKFPQPSKPKSGLSLPKSHTKTKIQAKLNAKDLALNKPITAIVTIKIDKGWHINASATADLLKPTKVTVMISNGKVKSDVQYPAGDEQTIGPEKTKILVYHGTVEIPIKITATEFSANADQGILTISADVQACNDEGRCLLPTTISTTVPLKFKNK